MHRIAIFSDVHGNLPALRAVLADIDRVDADSAFCLGDLVDFAPWPNEVIHDLRSRRIPVLMGNHDERIAKDLPVRALAKHTDAEQQARVAAIDFTRRAITAANKQYLGGLPRSIRISFGEDTHAREVMLVHASPRALDDYVFEDHPENDLRGLFSETRADVLVMGHTHYPYVRSLPSLTAAGHAKLAVNCGSVGRSKEADRLACYAMLSIDGDDLGAEIRKVPYDIGETIRAIRESAIPDIYAEFLERGLIMA